MTIYQFQPKAVRDLATARETEGAKRVALVAAVARMQRQWDAVIESGVVPSPEVAEAYTNALASAHALLSGTPKAPA